MAQQIVIDIGARIQVLQSSIVEVQKVLDRLQPNTSAWRELSKYIGTMRGELDKLTLQNGKPVLDPKQFTQAEKSIDKIEEMMGKTQLIIDRLKFSDIKLDPNQQKQFSDLQKEMSDAAAQFETFKQKVTQDFINSGSNKNILTNLFNVNILNKDLDFISNKINTELTKIKVEIENRTNEIENLKPGFKIAQALANGSNTDLLNQSFLGDEVYRKFFDKSGSFASGMKSQFYDMLADVFKLNETQKGQLSQLSANDLRSIFKGETLGATKGMKKLSDLIPKKNLDIGAGRETSLNDLINNLQKEQAQLENLKTTAGTSQADIEAQAQKTAAAQELVNQRVREFEAAVTNGARSAPGMINGLAQMNTQLQQTRDALAQTNAQFIQMERVRTSFNAMKMAVVNFMGFRQVLNLVKRGVQEALAHIKELDSVMNKISIVTDMSTSDLWGQVDAYSKLAQQYGVSIKGAYEVSQIYYQQGLETKDVMTLTNETLKLSKISGLDYATSTDYMTTAIRGFKMEMSDASTVVDVYSNLAANTAVSQEELAVAMSKTASSMEGVGATFEESSAMIATMVAVTRESATNIGSALKSIASRYGELTKDPTKLVDEEGEAMAFNKVDAALQSVGISMKTVDGQFRDFTDVIVELAERWNTLESTQQRYIATQFAGNRQQSRFLALVSNADLLKKNMAVAEDSEDVGSLQALKSLDSIESKLNQVQVAYQQFYTTIGAENVWKGLLDGTTNVINVLNGLPKLFGTIPTGAIAVIGSIISLIKSAGTAILTDIAQIWMSAIPQAGQAGQQAAQSFTNNLSEGLLGGVQKGFANLKNTFKDATYAIGFGRKKSVENQAKNTTDQLNTENARQEFDQLRTYAQEQLKVPIDLQFDASQPQASLNQLRTKLEELQQASNTTFKTPGIGTPGVTADAFTKSYEKYKELAKQAGKEPIEIKFDVNNAKKSVQELRNELNNLKQEGNTDLNRAVGNIKGQLTKDFGPETQAPPVPVNEYKELEATMNSISGVMTVLEQKGQKLSPREANAMYNQLTQYIKEASVELEKMKSVDGPDSSKIKEYEKSLEEAQQKAEELHTTIQKNKVASNSLGSAAASLNLIATLFNNGSEAGQRLSGAIMGIAGALYLVDGISKAINGGNPFMALAMGVMGIVNGIDRFIITDEEKIEILKKEAEELTTKAQQAKSDEKSLKKTVNDLKELSEKRYESAEAANKYTEAVNDLTTKFPGLIGGFDEAGNAILNASAQERLLAAARQKTAQATYEAAQKEYDLAQANLQKKTKDLNSGKNNIGEITNLTTGTAATMLQLETNTLSAWVEGVFSEFGMFDTSGQLQKIVSSTVPEVGENFASYLNRIKDQYLDYIKTNEPVNYDFYKEEFDKIDISTSSSEFIQRASAEFNNFNTVVSEAENKKILDLQALIKKYSSYSDKTSPEAIQTFADLKSAYEVLMKDEDAVKELDADQLKTIGKNIDDLVKVYSEINDLNEAFSANKSAVAAAYQSLKGVNYQYIKDSSSIMSIVTASIVNAVPDDKTWSDYINSAEGKQSVENKMKAANDTYLSLVGRYSSDGEELTTLFDKMMADASSYGLADIVSKFDIEKNSDFYGMLSEYYTDLSKTLYDNLEKYLASDDIQSAGLKIIQDKVDEVKKSGHLLVSDEAAFFTDLAKVVNNLDASGFSNLGKEVADFGTKLYQAIENIQDPLQKNTVSDLIRKNGLRTREGIQTSIDALTGMGFDKDSDIITNLMDLQKSIISNIPLAIQTATSNLLDTWEDTSKELTKAMSGGVSLKEANSLIQKAQSMGMDFGLSDFISTGDALILTSEKFNEYWEKLKETNKKNAESWQESIDAANNIYNIGSGEAFSYTEDQKRLLKEIGFDITDTKYYNEGKFTYDGIKELNRVINENQKNLDNYNKAAQIAADQLKNSYDRSQGIYKKNAEDEIPIEEDELRRIAKETKFNLQTSEGVTEKAIKESLNNAYNSLISDVLSKGFDNIDLSQYEGLINLGEGIELSGSYQDFINKYVDFTGKTIEEVNDLIVQAIEKDTQQTRGAADTVKNFKFIDSNTFAASLSDLQNLANAFGANINDWISQLEYDAVTGLYKGTKADLMEVNWDEIDNIEEIIVDSINEYIKSLVDGISKGLKGSLSNADVSNLNTSLSALGIDNLNLNFTKTADGLKLSQQSAIALYNELKKIDALQAKIVFDDLSKSMQDSDENYKNVSDIMAHIVDLQQKINEANAKGDSTKANQYREELAIAKEILAVRSASEDSSFDFMSNKIPGAQNNPLNYYSSWQKAIKTIQEGAKVKGKKNKTQYAKGFIDYKDFYNIATEMNNLAKISGQKFVLAGTTLDGSMEAASELIEKGAASLQAVDTGELKVNLKDVGLDILGGANSLSDGVDAGIHALAESQIKMLDGLISLLEAIVQMEKLSEIDLDESGTIDLSELGISVEGADKVGETTIENLKKFQNAATSFDNAVKAMGDSANEVFVNGRSLKDIAAKLKSAKNKDAAKAILKELNLSGQDLQTLFDGLYQLSKSQDWDESGANLQSMIDKYFAGTGLDISVDINPYKNVKFNYNDKDFQKKLQEVFKSKDAKKNKEDAQKLLNKAKKTPQDLSVIEQYRLNYLTGKITTSKGKDGKTKYNYNGKTYDSPEAVGKAINLEQKSQIEKATVKTDAKGNVIEWSGTKTIGSIKMNVTQKNGKTTYSAKDANGKLVKGTQQEVLNQVALSKLEKDSKKKDSNIKNVNIKDAKTGIANITIGDNKTPITVKVDKNGKIGYKGADGKFYSSLDACIRSRMKQDSRYKNRKNISSADFEKYKIEQGYTVVPTFENVNKNKLNQRNIKNLMNTSAKDLETEWKNADTEDKKLDFKYKYGFTLDKDSDTKDIQGLIDSLKEGSEEQTQTIKMEVTATASGTNKDVVQQILNKETITVPVELQVNIGEEGKLALTEDLTTVTGKAKTLEITPEKIIKSGDTNAVPTLETLSKAQAIVSELLITLGQKEGGQEGEQNVTDEVTPVWEEYSKKLRDAGFTEDQVTATVELLKIALGKKTDNSSGAESNNVDNEVEEVWNDLAEALKTGAGLSETEAKAVVTALRTSLTNTTPDNSDVTDAWTTLKTVLMNGSGLDETTATGIVDQIKAKLNTKQAENKDLSSIDLAWEVIKAILATKYKEDEVEAKVEKLKVGLGEGNTETGAGPVDTTEVDTGLQTALDNLSLEEKSVVLSTVILGLSSTAVTDKDGAASATFKSQVKAVLEAAGVDPVTLDNIDLFIQGFNLVNSLNNNTNELELDPNKVAQLQTLLNNALSAAALSGNISFASLVFNAFTGTPITTDLVSSLINEDGTLNIEALKNLEATATIKKLNLIVDSLTNGDGDTNVVTNDNGFTIQVTGATAEVTGISSIDLKNPVVDGKDVELTITNTQGNISTIKIPAQLSGVDISQYFDESGNYIGGNLSALVTAILNASAQALQAELDSKVGNLKVQVEPYFPANNNPTGLNTQENYNKLKEYLTNKGLGFGSEFINSSPEQLFGLNDKRRETLHEGYKSYVNENPGATALDYLQSDAGKTLYFELAVKQESVNQAEETIDTILAEMSNNPDLSFSAALESVNISSETLINAVNTLSKEFGDETPLTLDASADLTTVQQQIIEFINTNWQTTIKVEEKGADTAQKNIEDAAKNQTATINVKYNIPKTPTGLTATVAKGNVALAGGTLMGELGPELVVSHGRYFVVGQNGAEFVNLNDDAIVFNHLQTQSLLKNGKAGRGKPQTNERNATSFATGNVNGGPALASASSALSALKQLRAMWQSLLDASVQDMASKAGSGGGGGGGGKNNKGFMKEVERWYTLMQRIAQLEKDINYQEQLRNKIMSDRNGTGKQYWLSQKKSLNDLGQEISYQKELAISQQAYFEKRRAELNKQSGFSKLYTFDASGQLVYNDKAKLKNGKKGGLSFLSDLFATNTKTGAAKYSDKQKYNKLIDAGLVGSKVYDENGNLIKKPKKGAKKDEWDTYYTEVVKAFSSKMDADKEEMQKLHDSIDDANEKVLELEQQRNEILNEMRDKYLELEEQVFNAVKELKQRAIDELQDLKDATEKSNQRYLDGLNAALQREQNMYQKNESQNDLDKMRRQLAILQRSGGSASQIASLQNDIRSKEQDQYFDERQSQIDAIQKASDNQIKKMDQQIEIMQKTLDYQVKYGLLWKDVADIMKKSPKEIADFIKTNTSEYWGKSPDALNKANDELTKLIDYVAASNQQRKLLESVKQVDEQWKGSATTVWDKDKKQWKIQYNNQGTAAALKKQYSKKVWDAAGAEAKKQYYATYNRTGDPKAAAEAAKKVLDAEKKKQEPTKKNNNNNNNNDNKGDNKGSSGAKTIIKFHYKGKYTGANIQGYTSQSWKAGQRISYGAPPSSLKYKGKTIKVLGGWQSGNKNVPKSGSIAPSSNKTWKLTAYYDDAELDTARSQAGGWQVKYTDPTTKKPKTVHYSFKNNGNLAKSRAEAYAKKYKGAKVTRYATGGMVDYTGLAQVDGTPSKPEAFLNAKQTEVLKKGLLGGKNSLVSVLADFQAMIDSTSHTSTSSNEPSIIIENATVQMNVQKMNNDYDARRAGEQALEEMLKIARKTGATSVSRR